jgi:hypothetical protein
MVYALESSVVVLSLMCCGQTKALRIEIKAPAWLRQVAKLAITTHYSAGLQEAGALGTWELFPNVVTATIAHMSRRRRVHVAVVNHTLV